MRGLARAVSLSYSVIKKLSLSRRNEAKTAIFSLTEKQELLILVLALLVCDTAGCLASRLAGCLALAATAVLSALAKVTCLNCLDMLHESAPLS